MKDNILKSSLLTKIEETEFVSLKDILILVYRLVEF